MLKLIEADEEFILCLKNLEYISSKIFELLLKLKVSVLLIQKGTYFIKVLGSVPHFKPNQIILRSKIHHILQFPVIFRLYTGI